MRQQGNVKAHRARQFAAPACGSGRKRPAAYLAASSFITFTTDRPAPPR